MVDYKESSYIPVYDAPYQQYPVAIAEDLSIKYKNLIDAERKHFIQVESEYNNFIYQLDMLYKQLMEKYEIVQKDNERLFQDNQDLTRTLKRLEYEDQDRSQTLKKLYYACQKQTEKLQELEKRNYDLQQAVGVRHEKNLEINFELKNAIAQKTLLDERLYDVEGKLTAELARLRRTIDDRDRYIADIEKKLEDYSSLNLRISDDNRQLKLDNEAQRINYEGKIHQQILEIEHLRKIIDEERARAKVYQNYADTASGMDQSMRVKDLEKVLKPNNAFLEDEIRRLRRELEHSQKTITRMERQANPYKRFEAKNSERKVEGGRPGDDWDENGRGLSPNDFVERANQLVQLAQKNTIAHVRKFYTFALWKSTIANEVLQQKIEVVEDDLRQTQTLKATREVNISPDITELVEKLSELFIFVRVTIVDIVFEIFVRSANHAFTKKINSLILFIINLKELKENNSYIMVSFTQIYNRMKEILDEDKPKKQYKDSQIMDAVQSSMKKKGVDADFRDNVNAWIEDTIEEIDKKRSQSKENEANKEYLYLFRLLAIKYRTVNPMSQKRIDLDPDLQASLEDKICVAFLRALEVRDPQE